MKSSLGTELNVLSVEHIPLTGRHLIEASAGTGKTFNITRIYLRLIIERGLAVEQILVMTFTNAATEELRGRLSETLRQAQQYWRSEETRAEESDSIFAYLYANNDPEIALRQINQALLAMDEAAVFTLHGFCNRILKQLAFETGGALSVELNQDALPLMEQVVQDWFRTHRHDASIMWALAENGWQTPEAFYGAFGQLIYSSTPVELLRKETVERDINTSASVLLAHYAAELSAHYDNLCQHKNIIFDDLVDSHKQAEQRQYEWQVLLDWLANPSVDNIPDEVGAFLNGNRYRSKPESKQLLKPLADTRKSLKEARDKQRLQFERRTQMVASLDVIHSAIMWIRARLATEKHRRGEWGFDDLIQQVADTVAKSDALANGLVTQFPVALVDEFQDTDHQQYTILSKVYKPRATDEHRAESPLLMMIGDPKQAIYGFRGGDIYTYLKARSDAEYLWVMDTNWRSTHQMVAAYNRVFLGGPLVAPGYPVFGEQIGYEQVNSTPHAAAAKRPLHDPLSEHRKALTVVVSELSEEQLASSKADIKQTYQAQICTWMAAEIQRLLGESRLGERSTKPSDIAILVRDKNEAATVQSSLHRAGLNSVFLSDKTRLFVSLEAHELLRVLHGIWHYQSDSELVKALSSSFTGFPVENLHLMQSDPLHPSWGDARQLAQQLRHYWLTNGCLALILHMLRSHYQPRNNNERVLTNVLHIAESLQNHAQRNQHPLQVLQWFKQQINSPSGDEAFQQRLESDAALIKIVTQHKSKGLEYPFVFVPFANEYSDPAKQGNGFKAVYEFYDPERQQRICQLGPSEYALELVRQQAHEESVRLLYVAMTRPEYRCYMGVGPHLSNSQSPFGITLQIDAQEPNWLAALQVITDEPDSQCTVVKANTDCPQKISVSEVEPSESLTVQNLTVSLRTKWRIHSFSGLTKESSGTDLSGREHERFAPLAVSLIEPSILEPSNNQTVDGGIRFSFPKGALPGNFLHDALELAEFQRPNWPAVCEKVNQQYDLIHSDLQRQLTHQWLDDVLNTPLNIVRETVSDSVRLSQLANNQVAKEAEFYFPLSGGALTGLYAALSVHRNELCQRGLLDQVSMESHRLNDDVLEGMMHGFIDLTMQVNGRFYVVDYKSTYLGDHFDCYLPNDLCRNNTEHSYDLQYLIYSLALHRRLRNIIPDYRIERHFGGVIYLYLRGMHPNNQKQQGVFYAPISEQVLNLLDASFSGPVALGGGQ